MKFAWNDWRLVFFKAEDLMIGYWSWGIRGKADNLKTKESWERVWDQNDTLDLKLGRGNIEM